MARGRRGTRLGKCAIALCLALAALAAVPGAAAAKDQKRPLILVHGHEADSGSDCRGNWLNLMAHFRIYGYKGSFHPIQYYSKDDACRQYYGPGDSPEIMFATSSTPIQEISKKLAWYIYNRFNSRGVGVNILAHSMGGLIVRYMIDQVQRKKPGWPRAIVAPSVVTLGTPHNGIEQGPLHAGCWVFGGNTPQCRQMDKSSSFIEYLRDHARNPQSAFGTWWSVGGSHADLSVDEGSATEMAVRTKIRWTSDNNIKHGQYMHKKLGADPFRSSSLTAHCWKKNNGEAMRESRNCFWPIQWSYILLAYYGY